LPVATSWLCGCSVIAVALPAASVSVATVVSIEPSTFVKTARYS
jgi:hypothetical protein